MQPILQKPIAIAEPNFEKVSKIGTGSFGKVYKCRNTTTNEIFALKEMDISFANIMTIIAEINIIRMLPVHERLVTFFGIRNDGQRIQIFNEYMSKGSLRDHIEANGNLTEKKVAEYVKKTLEGIDYLHEHNIIHRDIKCGNILLDHNDNIKLADFGMSKAVDNKSVVENHTFCGTLYFMAPEILLRDHYSSSVDIWALGVTVVEMLTGLPLYFELRGGPFIEKITNKSPIELKLPNKPSKKLIYFLRLTFMKEPSARPKARDLLRTNFMITAA